METRDCELKKFEDFTEKGKSKIDEICQKATEVFSKRGYRNATLADVSRAADISKGGIYHYFSTKEELLYFILCRYMDQTLSELREEMKQFMTPQERIRVFVQHHIRHYRENLHESRLILHEAQNLPTNYWAIIRYKEKEYMKILKSSVESLSEAFENNPRRVGLIAYSLIGMCNWPYMWFNPDGPVSPEELAEEISRIFLGELGQDTHH
jgi:AcrR family transcriptional regulator